MNAASARLIETIRAAVIGADHVLDGPYGSRRVTYADYTASGRSLEFIEDFLREQVMPLYANTHTESSGTGRQTTAFREDARAISTTAMACRARSRATSGRSCSSARSSTTPTSCHGVSRSPRSA